MTRLIRENPSLALEESLSWSEWQSLPAPLQAEVESPFSRTVRYSVLPICTSIPFSTTSSPPTLSVLSVLSEPGSPVVNAYFPDDYQQITSKFQLAVQGIQLGNIAAIDPRPLSILSPDDAAAVSHLPLANPNPKADFATTFPLGETPITALCGGFRLLFANLTNATEFSDRLSHFNLLPDPNFSSAKLLAASAPTLESSSNPTTTSLTTSPNWTTSKKRLYLIRCDFSDFPSTSFPLPDAPAYQSQLNTEISSVIQEFSYGKTWIEATVSPSIQRITLPASYYTSQPDTTAANLSLYQDVITQFKSANPSFFEANYDIVGIRFASVGMKISGSVYNGLAEIGGSNLWLQGNVSTSTHVHEFGHNYGLDHSNFWQRPIDSSNPVDLNGVEENYGDPFDVMGSGSAPIAVFHADAKHRLNWLNPGDWTPVTSNGSYRLYRIDDSSTTGTRGLRITRNTDDYYWLSYRRAQNSFHLKSGASLTWQRPGEIKSWLIDTTPNSILGTSDRTDSPIRIGRTYSDTNANVHITPIGRGGSTPNEYLDVQVNFGPFPGNLPPSAQISGPSTLSVRQSAVFSISATDPNGDSSFAYDWSFGTSDTFDNNPSVVMLWNTPGTYQVSCTVSDLKGKKTIITKSVNVSEPMSSWHPRTNTAVGDFYTLINGPTQLVAAGSGFPSTYNGPLSYSTDGGSHWTSGKFSNFKHAYAGVWDGSKFVMAGLDYAYANSGSIRRNPEGYHAAIFTSPNVSFSSGVASFTTRYLGNLVNSFLWGIAYGNNTYVAVGDHGLILRSTDALTWTQVNAGVTGNFTHIAYGNGTFIAIGINDPYNTQKGFVYSSQDGLTWTNRTAAAGFNNQNYNYFWQVTYTYDRFLFSGWNVGLHYSINNGVSFVKARENAWEFTPAMAYGANMWFASGIDQANANATTDLISTDGTNRMF